MDDTKDGATLLGFDHKDGPASPRGWHVFDRKLTYTADTIMDDTRPIGCVFKFHASSKTINKED